MATRPVLLEHATALRAMDMGTLCTMSLDPRHGRILSAQSASRVPPFQLFWGRESRHDRHHTAESSWHNAVSSSR